MPRTRVPITPKWNGHCEVRPVGKATAKYTCGHDGPREAIAVFYGEERPIKYDHDPSKNECVQCLFDAAMRVSIRCCFCGRIILPGEGVALYDPKINPQIGKPDWATAILSGQLIGCLSTHCCPSGAFFAGQWSTKGFRPAFDGRNIAQEAMHTGKTVIVSNTDDL